MANLLQSTIYVRTFKMYLAGTKTPATGKTIVVNITKAGGARGAAAGAVAEISAGWYSVSFTTVDSNTIGDLGVDCTEAACDPTSFTDQVGPIPANLQQIDGNATSGNNATLNLKQLNVINNAGSAIVASSTGSNGHGISAGGNGTGNGVNASGGVTGNGIGGNGGVTSGSGMFLQALTLGPGLICAGVGSTGVGISATGDVNSAGVSLRGAGSGAGLLATGGLTGDGIKAVGGATSGAGITGLAVGSGNGLQVTGTSGGSGVSATGQGAAAGITAQGGATGDGLQVTGGASGGHGVHASAVAGSGILAVAGGNAAGLKAQGAGTGDGLLAVAGSTGNGIKGTGGVTSGAGLLTAAVGGGTGFTATGVGAVSILATQGISGPLDVSERNAIADALLTRDWTLVGVTAARSALNALRLFRNRWFISAGVLTCTTEDDTTPAFTATLATDPTADPVVSFTGN